MKRALGLLGLCARAGKIQSGEQACQLAVKHGQAQLLLLDGAASPLLRKAYFDACAHHHIPIRLTDADALGAAIGKPNRKVAVITDEKLAKKLADMLPDPLNADSADGAAPIHNH